MPVLNRINVFASAPGETTILLQDLHMAFSCKIQWRCLLEPCILHITHVQCYT